MAKWHEARPEGDPLGSPDHFAGPEFRTRAACRAHIVSQWDYVRTRKDLRCGPFYWRVPKPVRVTVTVTED